MYTISNPVHADVERFCNLLTIVVSKSTSAQFYMLNSSPRVLSGKGAPESEGLFVESWSPGGKAETTRTRSYQSFDIFTVCSADIYQVLTSIRQERRRIV